MAALSDTPDPDPNAAAPDAATPGFNEEAGYHKGLKPRQLR